MVFQCGKHRIYLLVVSVSLCLLNAAWGGVYGGGSGTAQDPYLIYTAEQLNEIGVNPSDWDKRFKLMADVNLSGYTGTQFNRIGINESNAFSGVFEGNGHIIFNFTFSSERWPS